MHLRPHFLEMSWRILWKNEKAVSKQPCWPLILRGGHADGLGFALPLHACNTLSLMGHSLDGRPTIRNPQTVRKRGLKRAHKGLKFNVLSACNRQCWDRQVQTANWEMDQNACAAHVSDGALPLTLSRDYFVSQSCTNSTSRSFQHSKGYQTHSKWAAQASPFVPCSSLLTTLTELDYSKIEIYLLPVTTLPNPTIIICHYAKQCVKKKSRQKDMCQ